MNKQTLRKIKEECFGKQCEECIFYKEDKQPMPCIFNIGINAPSQCEHDNIEKFVKDFDVDKKELKNRLTRLKLKNL